MKRIFLFRLGGQDYFFDKESRALVRTKHSKKSVNMQFWKSLFSVLVSLLSLIIGLQFLSTSRQQMFTTSLILLTVAVVLSEGLSFYFGAKEKKALHALGDFSAEPVKGRGLLIFSLFLGSFIWLFMMTTVHMSFIFALFYQQSGQGFWVTCSYVSIVLSGLSISYIRRGCQMFYRPFTAFFRKK